MDCNALIQAVSSHQRTVHIEVICLAVLVLYSHVRAPSQCSGTWLPITEATSCELMTPEWCSGRIAPEPHVLLTTSKQIL
jgi:hypothetical protein